MFRKIVIIIVVSFAIILLFFSVQKYQKGSTSSSVAITTEKNNVPATVPETAKDQANSIAVPQTNQLFQPSLDRAGERVTKKPFGIFITPQNSPVQPERFSGYHTGADFEIFPEELNADVPVHAICDGKLTVARTAGGYGGVAVESCELAGQPVTVVYGHLNLASVKFKVGDKIKAGDILAYLGADKSVQTDGERKHLHLGIHKGSATDIRGYVSSKAQLSGWIDPCEYICK